MVWAPPIKNPGYAYGVAGGFLGIPVCERLGQEPSNSCLFAIYGTNNVEYYFNTTICVFAYCLSPFPRSIQSHISKNCFFIELAAYTITSNVTMISDIVYPRG